MPKKKYNVWDELNKQLKNNVYESNMETPQTRFRKWGWYIVALLLAGCGVGVLIGYFLR